MNTKKDSFTIDNFHLSVYAWNVLAVTLLASILSVFTSVWVIIGVAGILFIHGMIMSVNRGKLRVTDTGKNKELILKDRKGEQRLIPPIEYEIWWNYNFGNSYTDIEYSTTYTEANSSNVYLKLKDKDGKQIVFHEKIKFGGQPPKRANYNPSLKIKAIRPKKTYKIDTLLTFLESKLSPQELYTSSNHTS